MTIKKKVLIVEDEIDLAQIIQETLMSAGFDAEIALRGDEAIPLIQKGNFDLVIVDFNMPGMNGLNLIKKIRFEKNYVPIIWTSGNVDKISYRETWKLGIFDYFEKPFNVTKLVAQCKSAVALGSQFVIESMADCLVKTNHVSVPVLLTNSVFDPLRVLAVAANKAPGDLIADWVESKLAELKLVKHQ